MFGLLDYLKLGCGAVVGAVLTFGAMSVYARLIHDPAVAEAARQGYVAVAEKTALTAQIVELKRQRDVATDAQEKAQKRASDAKQDAVDAQAKYEALVAADSGDDGCRFNSGDLEWLRRN